MMIIFGSFPWWKIKYCNPSTSLSYSIINHSSLLICKNDNETIFYHQHGIGILYINKIRTHSAIIKKSSSAIGKSRSNERERTVCMSHNVYLSIFCVIICCWHKFISTWLLKISDTHCSKIFRDACKYD